VSGRALAINRGACLLGWRLLCCAELLLYAAASRLQTNDAIKTAVRNFSHARAHPLNYPETILINFQLRRGPFLIGHLGRHSPFSVRRAERCLGVQLQQNQPAQRALTRELESVCVCDKLCRRARGLRCCLPLSHPGAQLHQTATTKTNGTWLDSIWTHLAPIFYRQSIARQPRVW